MIHCGYKLGFDSLQRYLACASIPEGKSEIEYPLIQNVGQIVEIALPVIKLTVLPFFILPPRDLHLPHQCAILACS